MSNTIKQHNEGDTDSGLPEGWVLSRINDLIEINYGKGLKEADRKPGAIPVYGSNGIVGSHNIALTEGPSIIIGRKGSVGAVHYSPTACWPIDTTYYVDKFNGLNHRFVMYALRLLDLCALDTSTAIPGLNRNDIYAQEMPLPPLDEQGRIVAKVEELLARVNSAKEDLAKVSVTLKRFRQAVLAVACSGRLTADWREANPSSTSYVEEELPLGWQTASVGEVMESLKYGTSQKCSYEKRGVPVLRIPNIEQGVVNHSDLKYAELQDREFQQLRLRSGDILMIRSNGSVSLVGKSALVRGIEKGFAYAGYLIRLRPDSSKIIPDFLNLVMGSHDVRVQIEVPARSTSGVHNINSKEVRALQFFLPPLGEQQEIVRRVESMFKLAEAVEKRLTAATARAEKLTQAILAKAFRGELVPTEAELARREGRSYEAASDLLARIKAERETSKKSESGYRRQLHKNTL